MATPPFISKPTENDSTPATQEMLTIGSLTESASAGSSIVALTVF